MRTKNWKLAILLFVAAGFAACDNDDDYYYVGGNDSWLTYGNLEAIDNGGYSNFAIRDDDGDRLIIADGVSVKGDGTKEGTRVYAHYAYLNSEYENDRLDGNMDYYIRLYGLEEVLTKAPILQSFVDADEAHRQDSIGNDPVAVSKAWFGGKYLNLEFNIPVQPASSTSHMLNLVQDDVTAHGDTVCLTFRHNAFGDKPSDNERKGNGKLYWSWGNVSFDLSTIVPAGETSVPVKLIWEGYTDGGAKTETMTLEGVFTLEDNGVEGKGLNYSAPNQYSGDEQTMTLAIE